VFCLTMYAFFKFLGSSSPLCFTITSTRIW
jgi:hypothetical protein